MSKSESFIVVSDTHGNQKHLSCLYDVLPNVNGIIHLGDHANDIDDFYVDEDKIVHKVRGNCDVPKSGPEEKIIKIGKFKVLLVHGHLYDVKNNLHLLHQKAREISCDAVFFGHSHIPFCACIDGIWMHNPGSLSLPKDNSTPGYSVVTATEETLKFERFDRP